LRNLSLKNRQYFIVASWVWNDKLGFIWARYADKRDAETGSSPCKGLNNNDFSQILLIFIDLNKYSLSKHKSLNIWGLMASRGGRTALHSLALPTANKKSDPKVAFLFVVALKGQLSNSFG